jgi:hypothetical protein
MGRMSMEYIFWILWVVNQMREWKNTRCVDVSGAPEIFGIWSACLAGGSKN